MQYKPLILTKVDWKNLCSSDYWDFIKKVVFEAGVRLLLERHRKRPDFSFPDTKFNPNTGDNLPEESYGVLYPWFFGRGAEACAAHLAILDELSGLADIREEARDLLSAFVKASTDAILNTIERNSGRCPFRVNANFQAIDSAGNIISVDPSVRSPADLFCAKGLLVSKEDEKIMVGKRMFWEFIEIACDSGYRSEYIDEPLEFLSHVPYMLALGAIRYLIVLDDKNANDYANLVASMVTTVLKRHYDAERCAFSEYVSKTTYQRQPYLNPGHAIEFVGLSLQAIEAIEKTGLQLSTNVKTIFEEAKTVLPIILINSFQSGYNAEHHGIFQAIDVETGAVLDENMPWWNLPETIRAATRAAVVTNDMSLKRKLLNIIMQCHNDYFTHYINPKLMCFPFRTRSGKTGHVVDIMPAVPEGDPLYHSNLSFIDMRDVLLRTMCQERVNN